jgi:hypothetical protein
MLERDEFRLRRIQRLEVVGAFLWYEGFERLTDRGPDGFEGSRGCFAQLALIDQPTARRENRSITADT